MEKASNALKINLEALPTKMKQVLQTFADKSGDVSFITPWPATLQDR